MPTSSGAASTNRSASIAMAMLGSPPLSLTPEAGPPHEPAPPGLPDELAVAHDHFAARHGENRPADAFEPLARLVAAAMVQIFVVNGGALLWIEQHDVRVGADRDAALGRRQPEQPCWLTRHDLHEPFGADTPFAHAFREDRPCLH